MTELSAVERLLCRDRVLLVSAMGVLFLLAGLYTILGIGMEMSSLEMTATGGMRDTTRMHEPGAWGPSRALLVFLMWWVMMIAMMLPGVTPAILLHAALLRHGGSGGALPTASAAFLCGYISAWAGFSLLATLAQWGAEVAGVVSPAMMALASPLPGGLLLIAAGAFQFTALKASCLDHCRSPMHFFSERRRPRTGGAFRMGMEHGTYCLACCWVLMALLFVGGIMNLYWIVGLSAYVALEKCLPAGRGLSRAAGSILIFWGSAIVVLHSRIAW
ncbi:DUF2182 domain-containing protein [Poseidonocella sp. HB161398]|uniref:DUF2182 domain-containing protein n=1 Tax=Poseidonocella sp. HB161398 TaxID=2320855 RepID=UPI00110990B5|nr:DUF2182 domain-containing protein [Poseidonocella sp. HB161398]